MSLNPGIEKFIEGRNGQGNLDYELFRIVSGDSFFFDVLKTLKHFLKLSFFYFLIGIARQKLRTGL